MLKKILLVAVLVVAVLLILIAIQPGEYRITRSTSVAAPAEAVFAEVNDFHRWAAWSPWTQLDPHANLAFEGPAAGTGAIFRWSGNQDVGEGSNTITESRSPELIKIRLDFVKPFADTADVEFTFTPEGNGTRVTWTMSGRNGFIGKAFCLFMNMDHMIGSQFEQGLSNLKAVVEKAVVEKPASETPVGEKSAEGAKPAVTPAG